MTLVERTGLNVLQRMVGRRQADRAADLYRHRLQPALESLTYRLDSRGRRSREVLEGMRDRYAGRRCFIIGNGPSLNRMDLSRLRGQDTFALNRGYLLRERIGEPTTFLVAVNQYVVEQFGSDIVTAPSGTFVSWRSRKWIPRGPDVTYVRRGRRFAFASNIARDGAWDGATVTFVALQLAFHLGFSDVILIGVDHSFASHGPANKLVTSSGADMNHFDPTYFGTGVRWQLPDLAVSEMAYRMACDAYEAAGRRVRDATVDGKLTVFPKVRYEDVV